MNLRNKAEMFASIYSAVEYQYENGPVSESSINWFVEGLNCQLLIHVAYQEFFSVTLPKHLRSSEMFADQDWFVDRKITGNGDFIGAQEGDLVFMGPGELSPNKDPQDDDAKLLHLAMIAEINHQSIDLIHARPYQGIIIEPMEKIMKLKRGNKRPYEKVFGVKGLKI